MNDLVYEYLYETDCIFIRSQLSKFKNVIIPFKPNGISHFYQLDQSIYVLRVVGWYYSFFFKFW